MLATDAGSVIAEGQSSQTRTYYAQAWALVCMLRHGEHGRYAAGFDHLLADIRSGELPTIAQAAKIRAAHPAATSFGEAVFRAYFEEDPHEFQPRYEAYLYKLVEFGKPEVAANKSESAGDSANFSNGKAAE
jgi:hypothetical protein